MCLACIMLSSTYLKYASISTIYPLCGCSYLKPFYNLTVERALYRSRLTAWLFDNALTLKTSYDVERLLFSINSVSTRHTADEYERIRSFVQCDYRQVEPLDDNKMPYYPAVEPLSS